ncbi:DUF59 domain-containing protein, partial [Mycobacterium tuberculosis]|nr:DUF59 domain-containing protein [Mycobacterium tuberculosis]
PVLARLKAVPGPDGSAPLADYSGLSEIVVGNGKVFFSIEVDAARAAALEPMRAAAEAAGEEGAAEGSAQGHRGARQAVVEDRRQADAAEAGCGEGGECATPEGAAGPGEDLDRLQFQGNLRHPEQVGDRHGGGQVGAAGVARLADGRQCQD